MLELVAFVSGASIMAIEIVASRILAPVLGNSIVVWSSLIGVILAALSYGYLKGGMLADRHASSDQLSLIVVSAALLTAFVAAGKNICLMRVSRLPDIRSAAIIAELVLFAPVSFLLAMVSPYVVRLKLKEVGCTGATVGRLYAISTIGSIVGTFSAGFYLLAVMGSTAILFCISGLLLVCSILLAMKRFLTLKIAAVIIVALCFYAAPSTATPFISGKHVFESDTHYNHCLVYEASDYQTGRPSRALLTDRFARQSAIFTDRNDDLVLEYLKYFRFGAHFVPNARRALLLGGGGFTYVADFFRRNPTKLLDVVELDPDLVKVADRYFGLRSDDPRLRVFTQDARVYLNQSRTDYDIVYLDTFGSAAIVPHYLTTRETARLVYHALSSDGVALLNVMSAVYGPRGRFLRAELATYRSVFPRVEIFKLNDDPEAVGNVIIVAFKNASTPRWTSDDPAISTRLSHRWTRPIPMDLPVLTDDYAPVEVYMMRCFF
ncbi:MAG TPA: fused MFS/spermidine synthase [Bryobacteraceae bacterium]|nr:fused MFS/spermidine synthase [Bryobacteraceae bacterium]